MIFRVFFAWLEKMFTSNAGTIMITFGLMIHLSLTQDETQNNSSRLIEIQIEQDEIKNIHNNCHYYIEHTLESQVVVSVWFN